MFSQCPGAQSAAHTCQPTTCRKTSWPRPHRLQRANIGQDQHKQHKTSFQRVRWRGSALHCSAAQADPYAVLGVGQDASVKDIKQAFRQRALKLHPDVNKAPDARERFMEAKEAFQLLSDSKRRAAFDRSRQGYSGRSWDPFGSSAQQASNAAEEAFYGLGEFFKDLDRELSQRAAKRSAAPKSLWQELADIGEELIEFLESELGLPPEGNGASQSPTDSKSTQEQAEEAVRASAEVKQNAQQHSSQVKSKPDMQAQQAVDDVEDMLADLKKKLGL